MNNKQTKYKHDTFILRVETYAAIEMLPIDQKGMLLDKIYHYAMNEEIYVSEQEKQLQDNSFLTAMFNVLKNALDCNWEKYEKQRIDKELKGRLNAIIGSLQRGQDLSTESITFLKENGFFTKEYLQKKDISDATINKLFKSDAKECYPDNLFN